MVIVVVVVPYDLFCFGVPVLSSQLFVVKVVVMDWRTRFDGYFHHIPFLYFLFEIDEIGWRISTSVFDRLDLLQMILIQVTIHAFVMNYNKRITLHNSQANLL
jgi:hypothetical protein